MSWREQVEGELARAESGLREGNEGLARVCARRAVALGAQNWVERSGTKAWPTDAMNILRKIQGEATVPSGVRAAAQRLLTAVTQQDHTPMSVDPIGDARLILSHFDQPL